MNSTEKHSDNINGETTAEHALLQRQKDSERGLPAAEPAGLLSSLLLRDPDEPDLAARARLHWFIAWIAGGPAATRRRILPPPDPAAPWALIENDGAIVTAYSVGELLDAGRHFLRPNGTCAQAHLGRSGKILDLYYEPEHPRCVHHQCWTLHPDCPI